MTHAFVDPEVKLVTTVTIGYNKIVAKILFH